MAKQDSAWGAVGTAGEEIEPLDIVTDGPHGYYTVTASSLCPDTDAGCDEFWIYDDDDNVRPKTEDEEE